MNPTPNFFYVRDEAERESFIKCIRSLKIPAKGLHFRWGVIQALRTLKQNNAMHKWFELLADALNNAGLTIHEEFLGKELEIEWDKDRVKSRIWKGPMRSMTGKKSTAQLKRKEVSEIYEVLNRYFAEHHGIHVPFPEEYR